MVSIIAETDEVLVLNKPAGLIVHSDGRTEEPSLADWIVEHYPALADVGEPWLSPQGERVLLPGIAHRLDRTTSGVMLIAKTPEMYAYLKQEFKERRVEKVYRAFVHGRMEQEEGRIVAEIVRSSEPPRRWYARQCDEGDKRAAITDWLLIKNLDSTNGHSNVLQNVAMTAEAAYIEVRPKTGRTHQIRVHFASVAHPLVADHLYSGDRPPILGFTRPALHAYSVSLHLPNGDAATFTAPLPSDWPL
ncbi:MAG TPA: RluA family pseudouridine synthase [Candidatus Paceibacterota bacterium]